MSISYTTIPGNAPVKPTQEPSPPSVSRDEMVQDSIKSALLNAEGTGATACPLLNESTNWFFTFAAIRIYVVVGLVFIAVMGFTPQFQGWFPEEHKTLYSTVWLMLVTTAGVLGWVVT